MTPKNWEKVWVTDILNVAQASEIIGASKRTVQQLIAQGKLPAQRKTPTSPYSLNYDDVLGFANTYKNNRKPRINIDVYSGERK